jgi:hypothetical protein
VTLTGANIDEYEPKFIDVDDAPHGLCHLASMLIEQKKKKNVCFWVGVGAPAPQNYIYSSDWRTRCFFPGR